MNNILSFRSALHRIARGLALAGVVGACAVAGISTASAQATAGKVFGKAPAGYSITVHTLAFNTLKNFIERFHHDVVIFVSDSLRCISLPALSFSIALGATTLSRRIFSCSFRKPPINASGLGGHPGT